MCEVIRKYYKRLLLRLGYTFVNRHGYKVWFENGKQVWDNPRRKEPYSMNDFSWTIVRD